MSPDLEAELAQAAMAMPWSACQLLRGLGVSKRVIARLCGEGLIGVARVDLSADGTEWAPGGPTQRLLLGVRDAWGEVIDVVALASHARDEWALRTGDGWALGLAALAQVEQARDEAVARAEPGKVPRPVRLRIHATPIDWLCGGMDGVCVLDWSATALTTLRSLGERVVLEVDPGTQERLRGLLSHGGLPRIEAAPSNRGLAA